MNGSVLKKKKREEREETPNGGVTRDFCECAGRVTCVRGYGQRLFVLWTTPRCDRDHDGDLVRFALFIAAVELDGYFKSWLWRNIFGWVLLKDCIWGGILSFCSQLCPFISTSKIAPT